MKTIIEPGRTAHNYWRDLWRFRELLYILAWRDIAVRYKQTVLGVGWALARPVMVMFAFLFFRHMVGLSTPGAPEPMLVIAGVMPWQFFSSALSDSSMSLVGNANLISKVYFPRLIIPCASVLTSLADFAVSLVLVLALMLWYGGLSQSRLALLPLFSLQLVALALGLGLLLAALNVKYRDFRYVAPFIVQFGVFVSPVGFSTADVPERWRLLYGLNPLAGAIDGFRWSILGEAAMIDGRVLALSSLMTVAILAAGARYFRRVENHFADVV